MTNTVTVTGIYTYPIKSCRGTSVQSAQIAPTGIQGDRQLMIVRDGKFTNQARLPKLARIATERIDATTIKLSCDDLSVVHTLSADGDVSELNFYLNMIPVVDQGDEIAAFVSAIAGSEVRVVALEGPFVRTVPLDEFAVVSGIEQKQFIDVAPLLVTNEASLADLNQRLSSAVPMNRFRPNIVVEGLEAYAEDEVAALSNDKLTFTRATYCERCAVTCTDQETGERTAEPLSTLKSYRHRENGYAGGVLFGSYMGVEGSATLNVGDTLQVQPL